MNITITKLKDIPYTILEKYKKEIKIPINVDANSAIYIAPSATDTDAQIHEMTKLIGMTKIAVVILDVDKLFVKEDIAFTPYSYATPRNIILSKDGRRIVKTFSDYLTEVNQFTQVIHTPETLTFFMCHSGLIY